MLVAGPAGGSGFRKDWACVCRCSQPDLLTRGERMTQVDQGWLLDFWLEEQGKCRYCLIYWRRLQKEQLGDREWYLRLYLGHVPCEVFVICSLEDAIWHARFSGLTPAYLSHHFLYWSVLCTRYPTQPACHLKRLFSAWTMHLENSTQYHVL